MHFKLPHFFRSLRLLNCIAVVVILLHSKTAYSQPYKDPVYIYTEEIYNKGVDFIADNSSYYPFTVKLIYSEFDNLAPSQTIVEAVVMNGRRTIHSLRVVVPDAGYSYNFKVSSIPGSGKLEPERDFIYLVPLKPGRVSEPGMTNNIFLVNSFMVDKGDTIYCSRKGIIAAVAGDNSGSFRLMNKGSFEIMHDDGTVMIYNDVNCNTLKLYPGTMIFPGDPIGVTEEKTSVFLQLLWLNGTSRFESLPISYAAGDTMSVSYMSLEGHLKSVHPEKLITKEMSEKEIKKRNKKLSAK